MQDNYCKEQEICELYSAEHKRKSHHIRLTVPCIYLKNGYCLHDTELKGQACSINKGGKKGVEE